MTAPRSAAEPRSIRIPVSSHAEVGARVYAAAVADAPVLALAHGAGGSQASPFVVDVATALAALGVTTITFNFPYTEARRRVPDRPPVLEDTWRAVVSHIRANGLATSGRLVLGGKSMGGRIASQVLASAGGPPPGVVGLVLLGYPLHPPGKPGQPRVAHLPALSTPTLVVHGTRDPFGAIEAVRAAFAVAPAPVDWLVVEGGDHSFAVPRGAPETTRQVFDRLVRELAGWVRGRDEDG